MKKLIFVALAALTAATPAMAQTSDAFTGPRAEAIVGYDKVDVNVGGLNNPDGVLYGAAIGYDVQFAGAVVGLEAEVADSDTDLSFAAVPGVRLVTDRDLYAGARVGYAKGNALVYGKVGYTNARFEGVALGFAGGENLDGVRVGGGLEYKLSSNLYAKAEYRYSNYEFDIERHQAVAGIGIRF